MSKYYLQSDLELQKQHDEFKPRVHTIKQVKKSTEIETQNGIALITEGNYIVTDPDGLKHGITEADLHARFVAVSND